MFKKWAVERRQEWKKYIYVALSYAKHEFQLVFLNTIYEFSSGNLIFYFISILQLICLKI